MSANVHVGHVSIPSNQPREVAGFYRALLGLEVSMEGSIPALGDFVFLSRRAQDELPLIALCTEQKARHSALEVQSLAELKELYANAQANGIPASFALNHGCSLSSCSRDPERTLLEVYRPPGHKTDEPISEPLELDL